MALVVARIDCQSSKTVKGTPSRSQYVMRSGREMSQIRDPTTDGAVKLTVPLLGKKQIGFPCCRQIGYTVSGIEHGWSWLVGMLLEILGVGPDGQRLVVSEATFIMELDLPAAFLFFLLRGPILDLVAYDFDVIPFWTDQMDQERPDDWCHARREDYDWDTVLSRPLVEVVEIGVELNVVAEFSDALRKGCFDALHHGPEGISAAVIRPSNNSHPIRKSHCRTEKCLFLLGHPYCPAGEGPHQSQGYPSEGHMSAMGWKETRTASTIQSLLSERVMVPARLLAISQLVGLEWIETAPSKSVKKMHMGFASKV